jgi:hypothetical protein
MSRLYGIDYFKEHCRPMGCDTVVSGRILSMFWRNMLFTILNEDGFIVFLSVCKFEPENMAARYFNCILFGHRRENLKWCSHFLCTLTAETS